ncbi:MAG: NF038122 family metalloprotease, partial [Acidobacteriota bacterium]|nr:NF038122 family metalloprotease [Acidobacteriota bacterium]
MKSSSQSQAAISGGENSSTGLTINLLALSQLQSDPDKATVIAAFERAAAVWTARIKSPVTVSMKIDYGSNRANGTAFPSDILGSTSSGSISDYYPSVRAKLIGSASDPVTELGIYNSLPASVIPTDTGDGSVIAISRSLSQTLGFLSPEPDTVVATISFNKTFAFDFNPDDGIDPGKIDFVGVAAHEIGHALGFTSNSGEGSTAQVALWDMFRFRPGTTSGTFPSAQRIMSMRGTQVYFTGQTFVGGTNELGLSTGGAEP